MIKDAIAKTRRERLEPFRRCRSRLRFQVDHSRHLEASVCSRCTAPLFARRRGQAETEFVPVRLHNHGTGGRKCGEGRGAPDWLCRLDRHTVSPHTRPRWPLHRASCRLPPFKTRLNTFPSFTPECRSQASRSSLLHDGTGIVRSRFPLPIKLTMTQRPSLDCNCSRFKPTTSERRSPHPNSNPSIAPSLQPRRLVLDAAFTSS